MKKLLSAIIVVTMLIGAMGTTAFAAYDFDATTDNTIKVDFVNPVPSEGQVIYDIELSAAADIQELNTADLTFKLIKDIGDINYEILVADEDIEINKVVENRYEFHYKAGNEAVENNIVIGKVKFTGYGQFDFYVDTAANDTNLVTATTVYNNLVTEFSANGSTDGVLDLSGVDGDDAADRITDEVIKIATRTLDIEIAFPNIANFNVDTYQKMAVAVTGGLVDETFVLGNTDKVATPADDTDDDVDYGSEKSDSVITKGTTIVSLEDKDGTPKDVEVNAYKIQVTIPMNTNYTIEVTGDGYRTARYNVVLSENKTVKFWNNVMDELRVMEVANDESKATVNFLAGDIVEDNNINIYDLSAVVSYFNTDLDETGATLEDLDFVKYDLNRDGIIDSKDVAYVLVSWGN